MRIIVHSDDGSHRGIDLREWDICNRVSASIGCADDDFVTIRWDDSSLELIQPHSNTRESGIQ